MKGHIDAYFETPVSVKQVALNLGFNLNSFVMLPVKGIPVFSPIYIVFPKTAWGKSFKTRIENILKKPEAIKYLGSLYEKWLPESLIPQYREDMKKYYSAYGINL